MRTPATKPRPAAGRRHFQRTPEPTQVAPRPPVPGIIQYRDDRPPLNAYPDRIVSPSRPRACCAEGMAQVGHAERDGAWEFYYKRCPVCGYTVRFYTSQGLDAILDELKGLFDAPESRWLSEVGEPEPAAA